MHGFFFPIGFFLRVMLLEIGKSIAFLIDIEDIERNLQTILFGFCARWKVVQEILK